MANRCKQLCDDYIGPIGVGVALIGIAFGLVAVALMLGSYAITGVQIEPDTVTRVVSGVFAMFLAGLVITFIAIVVVKWETS